MDPIAPDDPANAEYARPCPTCRALPGQPCTYVGASRTGAAMHDSHTARRADAPAPEPDPVVLPVQGLTAYLDYRAGQTVLVLEGRDGTLVHVVGSVSDLDGLVGDLDSLMVGAGE